MTGLGITYYGKRPADIVTAIAISVVVASWIRLMLVVNKLILLQQIAGYLVIGGGMVIVGVIIFRLFTFSKVFAIEMKPGALRIKHSEMEADKIKKIFIKGYFMPLIGIKLKGQLQVSYKHCFRFSDQEDQAIQALKEWADLHHIEVLHKGFKRWL